MSRDAASTGTRKCYHCGLPGHMGKDCTQAPKSGKEERVPKAKAAAEPSAASAAAAPAESAGTRKCYHCGLAGHMAKDCDQAPKAGKDGAARAKRSDKEKEKEEKSFKERLAEYKATNPEPGKKNFCYLCGKEGHRERDCPKNSKKKDEEKLCLRCGEAGHIARVCPTIANRTVYRNEERERRKGCYICEQEGHHAEECPQLEALSEEFDKFVSKLDSGIKVNVKVYDVLLEKCAKAMEINGALYLYEQLLQRGLEPTPNTHKHLQYMYDRSGKDQSKIASIPMKPKRIARLKEIVKGWKVADRKSQVEDRFIPHIVGHLKDPEQRKGAEACASLFDLAAWLKKAPIASLDEPLSSQAARLALSTLKSLGRYHQKNKGAEFDLEGDLSKPGKFAKKEGAPAAAAGASSKKKKKKASSKKKKQQGEGKEESEDGEEAEKPASKAKASKRKGDDEEAEAAAPQPAAKKQKKAAAAAAEPAASTKGKAKKQKVAGGAAKEEASAAEESAPAAAAAAGKKRKAKA